VVQVTELAPPVEQEAYPSTQALGSEPDEDPASEPIVSVPGPEAAEEEELEPFGGQEEEPEEFGDPEDAEELPLGTQPAPPPLPRLSLHLDVDFETGEAEISLDEESDVVRLILDEDGRWRLP
jgi:hypothetical protein